MDYNTIKESPRYRGLEWITRTFEELVGELSKLGVPFELNLSLKSFYYDVVDRTPQILGLSFDTPQHWHPQLIFPWGVHDGAHDQGPDVIVGFLHCFDDDDFNTKDISKCYCSIETYRFPFDHDDITVFNTPQECAQAIYNYYLEVKGAK